MSGNFWAHLATWPCTLCLKVRLHKFFLAEEDEFVVVLKVEEVGNSAGPNLNAARARENLTVDRVEFGRRAE